jgi:transposase
MARPGNQSRRIKRIVLAFEAGWDRLARWLRARGIEAYVIHPASIPVSREHRRAKTDRLDTMGAVLGWHRGEPKHCNMAAIPTVAKEDALRPTRERETLVREQTRAVNRIKSTLIRFGIRIVKVKLRQASKHLEELRGPEGEPLPPNTMAELRRDLARLQLIRGQIREIERARRERLKRAPRQGTHPMNGITTRKDWISCAQRASLLAVVERHRRSRDRAPPAFAPGRGFGGDGARCRR